MFGAVSVRLLLQTPLQAVAIARLQLLQILGSGMVAAVHSDGQTVLRVPPGRHPADPDVQIADVGVGQGGYAQAEVGRVGSCMCSSGCSHAAVRWMPQLVYGLSAAVHRARRAPAHVRMHRHARIYGRIRPPAQC